MARISRILMSTIVRSTDTESGDVVMPCITKDVAAQLSKLVKVALSCCRGRQLPGGGGGDSSASRALQVLGVWESCTLVQPHLNAKKSWTPGCWKLLMTACATQAQAACAQGGHGTPWTQAAHGGNSRLICESFIIIKTGFP